MERTKKNVRTTVARTTVSIIMAAVVLCVAEVATAAELDWPRDIEVAEGTITLYQPQLESFKGDRLSARAAISLTQKGETEPVFGAVWFDARVATDRDTRVVTLLDLDVPQAKFPNADPAKVEKLTALLKAEIPKWDATMSLDRLLTALDLVEKKKMAAENLKSTPPKIIVSKNPAVLVTIDGEPKLGQVEDSQLMQVVNTPFLIVYDPKTMVYYLKAGDDWLRASNIRGPWQDEDNPPAAATAAAAKIGTQQAEDAEFSPSEQMPQIIVATEPTELIVIEGEPEYSIITGTDLLAASNTEDDLFLHIGSQEYFVLLSGRWYKSAKLEQDEWSYVAADKLPGGFAKIPPGSDKGHVLANVAGTQQANDAVLDAHIPQTAAVKRSEAKVAVVYDGEPKFEKIEGTDMHYAENTSHSVIQVGGKYYCCHEAVWFMADSPSGPWVICTSVPQVIYTIPPSCPVYNVKYVYVYDYTPTVVYVGYTPGYVGCYVYRGTVVYGTGYVYRGWYRRVYYPRPVTYGFAVRYNPHTGGWGFRFGYRSGGRWFVGGGYRKGWWGAGGYRNIDVDVNRNISINRSRNNVYNRRADVVRRPTAGTPGIGRPVARDPRGVADTRGARDPRGAADPRGARDTRGVADPRGARDPRGVADTRGARDPRGVADTRGARDPRGAADPRGARDPRGPERANNVYADRNGNVQRRTESGWQQRDRSGWSNRASTRELDRQHNSRQRGTSRTQSYQRSRSYGGSTGGRSRSRGGSTGGRTSGRGGGGARRR
ncbi:MAG: carbohydrate-binding family V/XII [Planctomycetota bacterium]|jgi:hypothetical protein